MSFIRSSRDWEAFVDVLFKVLSSSGAKTTDELSNDPLKAKTLSSLLAYQDMAHGMKVSDVAVNNPYTSQVLYRMGFKWSPTTWDYVDRMLSAISGLGCFD